MLFTIIPNPFEIVKSTNKIIAPLGVGQGGWGCRNGTKNVHTFGQNQKGDICNYFMNPVIVKIISALTNFVNHIKAVNEMEHNVKVIVTYVVSILPVSM